MLRRRSCIWVQEALVGFDSLELRRHYKRREEGEASDHQRNWFDNMGDRIHVWLRNG